MDETTSGTVSIGLGVKEPTHPLVVEGEGNTVVFEGNSQLSGLRIEIFGSNNAILIEAKCTLTGRIQIRGEGSVVRIGTGTTAQGVTIAVAEGKSVRIGRDCMFSWGIMLRTSDGHSLIDMTTNRRFNFADDITIGDRVWISQQATILKGVQIADGCVVGVGSIVSKSIDLPNSLSVGVPARIVRTQVGWDRHFVDQLADVGDISQRDPTLRV